MRSIASLREILSSQDLAEIVKERRRRNRMAQRRALAVFRAEYPHMPRYHLPVLRFCISWLRARRKATWEAPLSEITHYLRLAAIASLGDDAEQIQDRGVAKIARALGATTSRANDGLMVFGIKPR